MILLPPSEAKATAAAGPPLDLAALGLPGLTAHRRRVLTALGALARGPAETARATLGLTAGQADAIGRNRVLRKAPGLPAAELYTGVLYDHLGLRTLSPAARALAAERVLIFSGLWGAVRLDDRIPPYRLSMGVRLPPLGGLAAFWRPVLTAELAPLAAERLVVDMRSAPYAAAWKPRRGLVPVRVLRERVVDGAVRRSVVSHMAKATRGAIARSLLEVAEAPATVEELAKVLLGLGHSVEVTAAGLDVIVAD